MAQFDLFGAPQRAEKSPPTLPDGFRYRRELITPAMEAKLLDHIRQLPLREFDFHGYTGKRRVVSFGWRYVGAGEYRRRAAIGVSVERGRPQRVGAQHSTGRRSEVFGDIPKP